MKHPKTTVQSQLNIRFLTFLLDEQSTQTLSQNRTVLLRFLGGADVATLNEARDRALEYRWLAKQGINPRYNGRQKIPCFEEIARQVHIERLPTWKNPKHGQQWINTLAE